MVFAKLVSLTQTFDSLGSINAPRHASVFEERTSEKRREEKERRREGKGRVKQKRTEGVWYPSTKYAKKKKKGTNGEKNDGYNDSYKLQDNEPRLFLVRALHISLDILHSHGREAEAEPSRRTGRSESETAVVV